MSESWAVPTTNMVLPPGFGFKFTPTNEELIKEYLEPKIMGTAASYDVDFIIPTVDDICNCDPSDLPSLCSKPWDNKMFCYFFCKWNRNGKGNQCCRKTSTGSWNKTGTELDIVDSKTKTVIGKRSIFRFRRGHGRTRAAKTSYIIHEYKIMNHSPRHQVICRLEKPATTGTKETEKNKVEVPQSLGNGGTCSVSPEASTLDFELNDGREPMVDDIAFDGAIPWPPQLEEARSNIETENGLKEWIVRLLSQSLGSPFDDGGESSVNITSYGDISSATATETQLVANVAMSSNQSLSCEPLSSPPHIRGEMQALSRIHSSSDFLEMLDMVCGPDDGSGQNVDNIFSGLYEPASTDVPESRNTDGGGGVNGLAESCSLAPGTHLQ